jgi:hypothetical protein
MRNTHAGKADQSHAKTEKHTHTHTHTHLWQHLHGQHQRRMAHSTRPPPHTHTPHVWHSFKNGRVSTTLCQHTQDGAPVASVHTHTCSRHKHTPLIPTRGCWLHGVVSRGASCPQTPSVILPQTACRLHPSWGQTLGWCPQTWEVPGSILAHHQLILLHL